MVRYSPIKSTTIDGICCLFMWKSNEIRFNEWGGIMLHIQVPLFWPETTGMLTLADHFETKLAVWLPLMHWKYPFPTSYIYILKLGETKAHTTEKRMFWSRPSFSVFRTIRKKKSTSKLGRRTSNPSPFSHLDSSPAAPWWWLWGLWPQRPPKATK